MTFTMCRELLFRLEIVSERERERERERDGGMVVFTFYHLILHQLLPAYYEKIM
jgi:hypothetical protein